MKLHKTDLVEYEKQKEFMKQLIKQIQSSISVDAVVLIANEPSHSYNLLRALKLRFAPTDQIRKIQIETKYRELTCSTAYLAGTVYSSHLNIKTTSSLPHGGDVNTDDNQKCPSVEVKYSVYQIFHQLHKKLSDVANHCNFSFC